MEIGARSAQVGYDALGSEGFQARDGFRRIGLVVEHRHLDLQLFAADAHAARGVDVLHGELIAGFDLAAQRRIASGERHYGADFDGLAVALGIKANSASPAKNETRIDRLMMPPLPESCEARR